MQNACIFDVSFMHIKYLWILRQSVLTSVELLLQIMTGIAFVETGGTVGDQ